MSSICRLNISNTLYEISPSPDGILDNTKYVSNDKSNTTEYINVDPITTTETNSSIFSKITTMIRNIRYIWSRIGTTDISSIGDSITSALVNSNNIATTKADNNTYGQVKIGDGLIVQDGVISADFKTIFLNFAYPIGTIYESTKSVSPSTFLGGTWEEYGSDRVLVGRGPYHRIGSTGGNRYISLDAGNLPRHSHQIDHVHTVIDRHHHDMYSNVARVGYTGYGYGISTKYFLENPGDYVLDEELDYTAPLYPRGDHTVDVALSEPLNIYISNEKSTVDPTGSGRDFNIEQPYVTVYRWRRTA